MKIIKTPCLGAVEASDIIHELQKTLDTAAVFVYCNPGAYCIFKGEVWDTQSSSWVLPGELLVEMDSGELVRIIEE